MSDRPRNDFKKRGGELLPRELLERAAEPTLVPDEALLAILLKTGAPGVNSEGTVPLWNSEGTVLLLRR